VLAEALRPGRRRQPDERHPLPLGPLHPVAIELEPAVGLVHDNDVGDRELAPSQGLNAGDLNRPAEIGQRVIGLDHADVADAVLPEPFDGLVDQADRRHGEDHPLALGEGALDDGRGEDSFATAGRGHDHGPAPTGDQRLAEHLQGLLLVGVEALHGVTPIRRFRGRSQGDSESKNSESRSESETNLSWMGDCDCEIVDV
jgi:hypothetical protein